MKHNILCSPLGFGWKALVHSYDARTTGRDGEGRARTHARASAHTRARTQHAHARQPPGQPVFAGSAVERRARRARRGRASPSARTTSLSPVRPNVSIKGRVGPRPQESPALTTAPARNRSESLSPARPPLRRRLSICGPKALPAEG